MYSNSNYYYSDVLLGMGIHGVIGGRCTSRDAGTNAEYPHYYKRTTADFYFRVQDGTQHRVPWVLSDPGGTHIPASCKNSLASAVAAWQALSEAEKQNWRDLARKWNAYQGYNLFLSRWLTGQI